MTMKPNRVRSREFDPVKSINELVNAMERQLGGGQGAECEAILSTARKVFSEFERAVIRLHEAGQTAVVEILTEDIARCMRRAARLAGEHGATVTAEVSRV